MKPIIGNKDIERAAELVFNAQLLPFAAWTAEEVSAKIETMEVENHLHEVYCAMGANPKTPKPQFVLQNLSEIKKCEINICVPSKGMALYNIIIIAQLLIS